MMQNKNIAQHHQVNNSLAKSKLKYLLNSMPLNCAKYQQKNLQYLKVLYLINHWWTIEQKNL